MHKQPNQCIKSFFCFPPTTSNNQRFNELSRSNRIGRTRKNSHSQIVNGNPTTNFDLPEQKSQEKAATNQRASAKPGETRNFDYLKKLANENYRPHKKTANLNKNASLIVLKMPSNQTTAMTAIEVQGRITDQAYSLICNQERDKSSTYPHLQMLYDDKQN